MLGETINCNNRNISELYKDNVNKCNHSLTLMHTVLIGNPRNLKEDRVTCPKKDHVLQISSGSRSRDWKF